MIPTEEDLKKIKLQATLYNELDEYVWLREDEKGRYIEYAFLEGVPHDNRCLSWYDKPHPKAWKQKVERDGGIWTEETEKKWNQARLHKVNEFYRCYEYACDRQNREGNEKCSAGHPAKKCQSWFARDWTYEEPVKCACWCLGEPSIPKTVIIPIQTALALEDRLVETK